MRADRFLAAAAPTDAVAAAAATTATAAATPTANADTATATSEPSTSAGPSGPPDPIAPTGACTRAVRGHAAAQQLPPRSQRNPERVHLLALLLGRPFVADVCVTHPLGASTVKAAAPDTCAPANGKDSLKRDKYSRTGTDTCRFVPLSGDV